MIEAAKDVASAPEDADAHGNLRLQLRKLLETQPALIDELFKIIGPAANQRDIAVADGTGAIAVGGSVSGSTPSFNVNS